MKAGTSGSRQRRKEDFMFYRKNLPGWERAMRVIAGVVLIAWGLLAFPAAPLGYVIAASGATAIITSFFGFGPVCAMVGRKLPSP
jgi:Protein of unknown function (DUF2892)